MVKRHGKWRISWLASLVMVGGLGLSCASGQGCPVYPTPPIPSAYVIEQTVWIEGTELEAYLMDLEALAAAVDAGNRAE